MKSFALAIRRFVLYKTIVDFLLEALIFIYNRTPKNSYRYIAHRYLRSDDMISAINLLFIILVLSVQEVLNENRRIKQQSPETP